MPQKISTVNKSQEIIASKRFVAHAYWSHPPRKDLTPDPDMISSTQYIITIN